jgi:hypothetical protein
MDEGSINAGLVHFLQHVLGGDLRHLAVLAGRRRDGLAPDMDLGIDDLHGVSPFSLGARHSSGAFLSFLNGAGSRASEGAAARQRM